MSYEFVNRSSPLSERKVGGITLIEYIGRKQVFNREQQLLKDYQLDTCPVCQKVWKLTVDHIVPIDWLEEFGLSPKHFLIPENLRVLCERCNGYKGNRLDFSLPETKKILLALLETI